AGVGGHRTREAMAQRSARARDVPGGAVVRLTLAGHAVADVTRAATTGSMITRRTTGTQVPERGIVETGLEERQDGRAHFELGAVPAIRKRVVAAFLYAKGIRRWEGLPGGH